jgi:Ca2+-binding RTX toxin-like protein
VDDLLVEIGADGTRVRVTNQFLGDEANPYGVERIAFDDGTVWDRAAIRAGVVAATAGADVLIGFSGNDSINGLAGNDLIEGAAGNDTLYGGTGNDQITGGLGDDTFLFNLGDGQDIFSDKYSAAGFPGGGTETLILGPGITPANVTATKTLNNELNLQVNGTSDLVRLSQYFGDDAIERIQFGDGTVWTPQTVASMFPITGTAGNDTLTGSGLPDTINALQGNDVVYGGGGNDTIDGGLGYDRLYGDAGDDIINGGAADTTRKASSDTLYGGSGNDVLIVGSANGQALYGEAGNDIYIAGSGWTWMEDTGGSNLFLGGSASDDINMGDGNDLAIGGRGSDSYDGDRDGDGILGRDVLAFNKGDGQDNVWELDAASTISLGGGTLYSNLSLEVSTVSLKLNVATSSITFQRWYDVAPFATPKIKYLQIVIEGTKLYSPSSADPMRNQKVQYFDFLGLVAAFDAARAAGQNFNVADNLARFRLWGSNDVAFGGALAYQYAKSGSLGTLSYQQMRAVIGDPAFGNAAQPIVAPAGAAATAESVAIQDAGVATEPITLAAASGTSEPAQVLPSDTNSTTPSRTRSAAHIADLPDEWFAPRAPQESARSVASAWHRVARDLPAHLDRDGALDGAPPFVNGVRVSPADAIGVRVTFDNGVGLSDAAAGRLRQFEGIKEGFALLA